MSQDQRDLAFPIAQYLDRMRVLGVDPNFFMSAEYLYHKGVAPLSLPNGVWGLVEYGEYGWFLPPLDGLGHLFPARKVYAGLPNITGTEFLDYQFIYDPNRFLDLSGHHWSTFRKNIRKWPNRVGTPYSYRPLIEGVHEDQVADLLEVWAKGDTIHDPETMSRIALFGQHRWGLFSDEKLVGLNACDLNWKYINFRVCIDSGEPFIQEYLRYCFYTSDFVQESNRLVNDGGCLGLAGLEQFKMKLNPLRIDQIYSSNGSSGGME
ncbi:hypothetical protein M0R72_14745 [Candidatus Pacearchaeota archaeon]|nr:hypothetical protein [Candidatus Pacearchaeota archaeon]